MPHLTPALQELINLRLDTIDRVLLNVVSRTDRVGIVSEVEAQIFELLSERGTDELTRDDVLAVLARLDPSEAYIPEQSNQQTRAPSDGERPRQATETRAGIAGGIVGMSALGTLLVMPLVYLVAAVLGSDEALLLAAGLTGLGGLLLVLSLYERLRSGFSVVGAITLALALLLSFSSGMFLWVSF